ncbi:MAG: hypothetical protein Fur005_13300 [Roseiflexaceae bacterium]
MRRIVQALLVALLALVPFLASAQSSVTGSGFQVQNLSETQPANIVITYYTSTGSTVTQSAQIPAGASLTFFNGQGGTVAMSAPAGFRGSVVISSDQPIAAITNLIGSGVGESYGGFASGSQTVSVPLITRNNFGNTTVLTVQNTGSASTDVTVTYTPGTVGNTGVTDTATIPAGASATFEQSSKTALGDRFVGSATVTASTGGSIVAIVNQEGNSQLLTYNGFTAAGASIAVPLLVANNFGSLTGLQVQNTGSSSANVTVTYTPNTVADAGTAASVCGTPTAETATIAAGGSKTFIQAGGDSAEGFNNFFATCRYVGGATITATGGSLVAIVNQVAGTSASSYESFSVAAATNTVKVPLAMANNFGNYTGIQIQNVGSSSAQVTLAYGTNTVTDAGTAASVCGTPTSRTVTVAAGSSYTFIQSADGSDANGFDSQFSGCRYVGSATISTATGGKIVAIVNQAASGTGDTLYTYNAFNQ